MVTNHRPAVLLLGKDDAPIESDDAAEDQDPPAPEMPAHTFVEENDTPEGDEEHLRGQQQTALGTRAVMEALIHEQLRNERGADNTPHKQPFMDG